MGIIELFYDVHKIKENSDESLKELRAQGENLIKLVDTCDSINQKIHGLLLASAETNQKLGALVVIQLKMLELMGGDKPPDVEKVVGIGITPGPVTEHTTPPPGSKSTQPPQPVPKPHPPAPGSGVKSPV